MSCYSFEHSAPRETTNAEKYTLREKLFGTTDVEPLWVADMDIDTPDFVLKSVTSRLEHPIVGYEEVPTSAFIAQRDWIFQKYGVKLDTEDFFYSPSVVSSMNATIEAFSNEGDEVIIFNSQEMIEEISKNLDTIPYELLTMISQRIKRILI